LADKIDPKLFSSDLRQQLFADQTPTHELGRSFGWDLRYDSKGQACIYHTGYTGTFMLLDLATKQALIVLTNRIHPDEHNEIFLEKRDQIIATYLKEKDH
jgi:CubicO group peptidase (beta-lactamase class C family)